MATGGTLFTNGDLLQEKNLIPPDDQEVRNLILISVFTSIPGLQRIYERFPKVPVYTCRIIRRLDEKCYMISGPGDAGLRCSYPLTIINRMRVH